MARMLNSLDNRRAAADRPTDRRRRVTVRDRLRQSGHRQRPSGHSDVTVQNDVAVQNNGAAAQPVVDTAADTYGGPLGHLAVSPSRRRCRGIIPLRFANSLMLLLRSG